MPVIGTAGHVDHGKSTLTRALSGRDPDRWKEEKERGLTIDLGFAWTTLDDIEVSFVDVPGHERYSKNMLAGIEAIDVALLVVAADEGWMPQSEEHLAILHLLGVDRAVIALSKVDRVDPDLVELATLEIEDHLAGTTLENSPIIGVSAVTGEGLAMLRAALAVAAGTVGPPAVDRPRLWVDRVFSATGAGTVVTGTLLGGRIAVDEHMHLHPGFVDCRIRGIQSHETARDVVDPHRRVALNLGGVGVAQIERGSMLGRPGDWRVTDRVAATFRTARYVDAVPSRGAYHLHVGSGAWPVRFRQIDDEVAMLDLPIELPLAMGDRFILRDTGRRMVVAGGRVIDPSPPTPRRLRPHAAALRASLERSPDDRARALLALRGRELVTALAADTGGGGVDEGVRAGGSVLTVATADRLGGQLGDMVAAFHRQHPLRPGLPAAEAASRLGLEADALSVIAAREAELELDSAHLRATSFTGTRSEAQEQSWQKARLLLAEAGAAAAPRIDELGIGLELAHSLARAGELVRISESLVLLPDQVEALLGIVGSFDKPFTVSEFKERSNLSRKYAVPFLEWADQAGHTVRQGDTRRAR